LRAREVPRWYEEGMILYLTGEKLSAPPAMPVEPSQTSEHAKMERSYALARERVADLARRRGKNALWEILQNPSAEDLAWFKKANQTTVFFRIVPARRWETVRLEASKTGGAVRVRASRRASPRRRLLELVHCE